MKNFRFKIWYSKYDYYYKTIKATDYRSAVALICFKNAQIELLGVYED